MTIQEIIDDAKKQAIIDLLCELDDGDRLTIWNEYCQECNYDDVVFTNDEDFLQTYFENDLMRLASCITYGDYSVNHDYVKFDGYGNLESSYNWEDLADWDEDVLAEWILEQDGHWLLDWDEVEQAAASAVEMVCTEETATMPEFDDLPELIDFAMDNPEYEDSEIVAMYICYTEAEE